MSLVTGMPASESLKRRLAHLEHGPRWTSEDPGQLAEILNDFQYEEEYFKDRDVFERIVRISLRKYGIKPHQLAELFGACGTELLIEYYATGQSSPHHEVRPVFVALLRENFDELLRKSFESVTP